jgi:hypothetical protein
MIGGGPAILIEAQEGKIPVRDKKTELNIVNLITTVAERGAPPLKSTDIRFTKNQLQARTNLEALVS